MKFFVAMSKNASRSVIIKWAMASLPLKAHLALGLHAHFVLAVGINAIIALGAHARLLINLANFCGDEKKKMVGWGMRYRKQLSYAR